MRAVDTITPLLYIDAYPSLQFSLKEH